MTGVQRSKAKHKEIVIPILSVARDDFTVRKYVGIQAVYFS